MQLGKPPSDVSGQGALTELRASLGYSGEPASLANFQIDRVSLPSIAGSPSSLETILGSAEAEKMLEILRSKILTFGEVEAKLKGSSLRKPYFDPCLRKGGTEYQQFIRRLLQSNLIDFRLSVREKAGLFVVWKKSGKQRLVVDARRSNCWFGSPCPVKLATGSSFAQIEVDHADPIELAGVDIADAFYGIELPDEFRDLFGLAPLTAEQAGISMVQGAPVARDQVVFPVFRVVPMGWTHALWICQQCHEKVVDSISTIPPALRFHDGAPIPAPRPFLHTQYVDNYIAISQEHGIAGKSAHDVAQALNQRGLPTHDVEDDIGGETLGWKFSDTAAQVTMTPRRLWKLRLGVLELLSQGWATGQLVEKLLGHLTFASLLRRELLSCFQATYVFVKKCYHVHSRLWPQVVRELKWACSLLPLVSRNMAAPWSPQVLATDASHWGRGVAKMTSTQEQVRAQARIQDRWRFTSDQERLLLSGHEADDVMHALSDVGEGQSQHDMLSLPVPELDVEFLNSEWTRVESRAWDRQEHIVTLEGRALVWAVQHLARSVNNHEKRHLLLSDSMSCVLALTKGRGGSSGMNRICRQIEALSLACDFQLHYRWCPSELNPADKPSRNRILSNYNIWDSIGDLINAEESHRSRHSWRQQAAAYYAACRNGGKEWEFWARRRAELAGWHKSQGPEADQVECQAVSARSAKASSPFKDSDPNLPGRKGHHQHSVAIIRDGLDEVSRVCRGPRLSHDLPQRGGCSSGLVDGHDVLRGRWCVGGNDYDGSHQTHENRCAEAQLAGEVLKISSCLQEVGATHGQSPTSISHVGTGVVKHIVIELTEPMVGVHLILTWSLCCRPGESLKLKWRQIVAPNQVNRRWSVLLSESSPVEGQSQPSKTHELDEAVLIDHPYLLWLGAILKHLKKGKRASMPVFDFKMAHVSSVFGQALDACGYRPHGVQSVYQIRHGSASTDRLTQQRSMEELMKRGRWRSLSSLRRYEQGGRISQVFGCLSPEEQKAALMAEKQLPIILGRCVGCSKLPNAASSLSFSPGLAD